MTPERWKQIREILEPAAEMSTGPRLSFVAQKCGSDLELRTEIESLLSTRSRADAFERDPFVDDEINAAPSRIGETIGNYRITDELGNGGMGSVYLAVRSDGSFEQEVALKLIKRGMDSDAILRRFSNERQILASLDHPNIARLIDGGTSRDGQPYFVMECVRGENIVDFARNRTLGLSERLDLFREVCSAVSYAHQNLVIHRDLKPSNILVNTAGVPKLLDFGIAKLLKSENLAETMTRHAVFTPEYASPEQIRGENLTTSTDIYSLGAILYELLTGVRPFAFEDKNLGQILQTATSTQPVRPSDNRISDEQLKDAAKPFARNHLRGDLDNIVLKALRKEPERRYSSVEQFAEDIRRHLRGLPVLARQSTLRYRAATFTRRNPFLVVAMAAVFLTLIAGITATTIMARRAESERQKAERRFDDVRAIASSLIFEVNEKIDESPIKARELLVTRTIEYLDKLAAEAGENKSLQSELAAAYEKIGDVQAFHFGSGTGDTDGALRNHEKALEMRLAMALGQPGDPMHKLALASSYLKIADLSTTLGRTGTALEKYQLAVSTIEDAKAIAPANLEVNRELARAYAKFGQGVLRSGSISNALASYEKAIELAVELAVVEQGNWRSHHRVAVYKSYAGYAKLEMGASDEAFDNFSQALHINRELWESDRESAEHLRNLASGEQWAGIALRSLKRFDESRSHLQKAVEIQNRLHERDRSNSGDVNSLADAYLELGWTESDAGNARVAIEYLEKALALYGKVVVTDKNNLSARRQMSFTRRHLGDALIRNGESGRAVQAFVAALKETDVLIEKDAQNDEFRHDKAICLSRLGENGLNTQKNLAEARIILEELFTESPEHARWHDDLLHVRKLLENK
jgi:non-specific serine/threonine protein kinase/serine/threonine-protein kinase